MNTNPNAPLIRKKGSTAEHDACVAAYRANSTGKCPTEVIAGRVREDAEFGLDEYMQIGRTCTLADCPAKYHWCPTCCLAPRCDCRMPHQSPKIDEDTDAIKWVPDQRSMLIRLRKIPCDNRYWTFVRAVKSAASLSGQKDGSTPATFCEICASFIRSIRGDILAVFGRTYLEQAHRIWSILSGEICDICIESINRLPCMRMDSDCPSAELGLITIRLETYQSRTSRDRTPAMEHTRISSIRSALMNAANAPATRTPEIKPASLTSKSGGRQMPRITGNVTIRYGTIRGSSKRQPRTSESQPQVATAEHAEGGEIVRAEEWARFWLDPNGSIESLVG